jgi:hypothetical protein
LFWLEKESNAWVRVFFNGEGEIGCPPQKEKKGKVLLQGGPSAVCCGKPQEENQALPFSAREVWS